MGRFAPWLLTLAGLGGCAPDPCLPLREVPIYRGAVATDEMIEQVREVMDTFSDWTDDDDVCLTEVRFEAGMEENGYGLLGMYTAAPYQTITLDVDNPDDLPTTTRHELCHALDIAHGLSADHADLLHGWGAELPEGLYPTPEDVLAELFARECEQGPPNRAWTEASEDLGAPPSDWTHFLLDDVYPEYEEPVGLSAGPAWTARRVVAPGLIAGGRPALQGIYGTPDGFLAIGWPSQPEAPSAETGATSRAARYWLYQVATDTWSQVQLPRPGGSWPTPLSTVFGTDLYLRAQSLTGGVEHLYRLHGTELVKVDDRWDEALTSDDVTWRFDGDRVAWQQWGDGRPVQVRSLFPLGNPHPLEASGLWGIDPPSARLPEGDFALAWDPLMARQLPMIYAGVNVVPADVPLHIKPWGTLPDGTVIAPTNVEDADGESVEGMAWRGPDDAWKLGKVHDYVGGEHTTGPAGAPNRYALSLVDGHLYRLRLTSRGPRLDELLPPE